MKKKVLLFFSFLFFFLLFWEVGKTYSLFETNLEFEVSSDLASWKIKVGDTYITTLVSSDSEFDLSTVLWSNAKHVKEGKGYPGAVGRFQIVIEPLTTDVSFLYSLKFDMDKLGNDKIQIVGVSLENGKEFYHMKDNTYVGIARLKDIKAGVKYVLDVELKWNDEISDDIINSEDGNNAANQVMLPIHIEVGQYNGEKITEE